MVQRPLCPHFPKLSNCPFPALMSLSAPEFKQKEECTIRGRSLIQISIQEDPWNLPNSIKTLVDNIQRYVEGQLGREGCDVEVLWPLVLDGQRGRIRNGSISVPHVSPGPGRGQEESVSLSQLCPALGKALGQYTLDQGTADLGCLGLPCRVRRLRRLNLFLLSFQNCGCSSVPFVY